MQNLNIHKVKTVYDLFESHEAIYEQLMRSLVPVEEFYELRRRTAQMILDTIRNEVSEEFTGMDYESYKDSLKAKK